MQSIQDISLNDLVEFSNVHGGDIEVIEDISTLVIQNRYKLEKKIGEGTFGHIYSGLDLMDVINEYGQYRQIIFKFTQDHEMNIKEY